jgi:hypothetical protein
MTKARTIRIPPGNTMISGLDLNLCVLVSFL